MHEVDGICYAGVPSKGPRVIEALPLVGGMPLVTFSSGERRLLDTTSVTGSAFAPLRDGSAHASFQVEHGFASWFGGAIDLAPEYIYEHSVTYNDVPDGLLAG